jgi:hypothetical protein
MLNRIFFLLVLLMVSVQAVRGQESPPRREIYVALAYGDDIFEPEMWHASAHEEAAQTTALWESDDYGALGFLEYLHFDDGVTEELLKTTFDHDWFEVTFENYDSWEQVAQCQYDGTTLYEFDVLNNDIAYRMRYWIRVETETRAITFFLIFPADQMETLDNYSARFDPVAVSCEPG